MKVKNCCLLLAVTSFYSVLLFTGCQNTTVTSEDKKNDSCIRCVNPGSAISMLAHRGGADSLRMPPGSAGNVIVAVQDTTN